MPVGLYIYFANMMVGYIKPSISDIEDALRGFLSKAQWSYAVFDVFLEQRKIY
jgi:hypothetical protein